MLHCRLGYQILKGIEAIHEVGFLHRDIKPSNFAGKIIAMNSAKFAAICYSWEDPADHEEDLHVGLRSGEAVHQRQWGG